MRHARSLALWLLLGGWCVAQPRAASAQSTVEEMHGVANEKARETFKEGIEAFDRRDFEAARVAFLQTFALKPTAPVVRRNLGLAEIYSGHYLDGARRLARVLHTTDEGTAQDRARMLESLHKAEAHLERLTLEVNLEGAQIIVDGVDLGTSPLPFVWYMAPGSYDVRVQKEGYTPFFQRRIAHAGSAEHLRVSLKLEAHGEPPASLPPAAPLEPSVDAGPSSWLLITGGAATAVGLAAGVGFTLAAGANADKVEGIVQSLQGVRCPSPEFNEKCAPLRSATEQHDRQQTWAMVSFVAAGVTGLSTLLYGLLATAAERRSTGVDAEGRPAAAQSQLLVGFDPVGRALFFQTAF